MSYIYIISNLRIHLQLDVQSVEKCVRTHFSTYKTAYTDACKTYRTITVYTTVFLKMNSRFRNI